MAMNTLSIENIDSVYQTNISNWVLEQKTIFYENSTGVSFLMATFTNMD